MPKINNYCVCDICGKKVLRKSLKSHHKSFYCKSIKKTNEKHMILLQQCLTFPLIHTSKFILF